MVVTSVGKRRLLNYIFGITVLLVAFGFTLYLYAYMSEFASQSSSLTMKPSEIPRLFLYFLIVLGLGILGGYEIGTFRESQNEKKTRLT